MSASTRLRRAIHAHQPREPGKSLLHSFHHAMRAPLDAVGLEVRYRDLEGWVSGQFPPRAYLEVAAEQLGVDAAWLVSGRGDEPDPDPEPSRPEHTPSFSDMTKAELMEIAQDLDLPGRSSMTKAELVAALEAL